MSVIWQKASATTESRLVNIPNRMKVSHKSNNAAFSSRIRFCKSNFTAEWDNVGIVKQWWRKLQDWTHRSVDNSPLLSDDVNWHCNVWYCGSSIELTASCRGRRAGTGQCISRPGSQQRGRHRRRRRFTCPASRDSSFCAVCASTRSLPARHWHDRGGGCRDPPRRCTDCRSVEQIADS